MKSVAMIPAIATALSLVLSSPSWAVTTLPPAAPASACLQPGLSFHFADVPAKGGHLPNEIRRTIGGIAIRVREDNCNVDLLCIAADKTPEARQIAAQRCTIVRDALLKANRKKGFTKDNMTIKRKPPGPGLVPNLVYLTFR